MPKENLLNGNGEMKNNMKKIFLTLGIFALIGGGFFVFNEYIYEEKQENSKNFPDFSSYPVDYDFFGTPAEPDFSTNTNALQFVTKIKEGAKNGPNFAGKYTIVTWGCGTSCQSSAILDTENGKIITLGIISAYGISYRLDSNLLIINPKENIPESLLNENTYPNEHYPLGSVPGGSDYYYFENEELKFIDRYNFKTGEGTMCIQVITPARNPVTGEVLDFPTPCSIPFGWEALELMEGGEI